MEYAISRKTSIVLVVAGVLLVGMLVLAVTGTVAAGAGQEMSACSSRLH